MKLNPAFKYQLYGFKKPMIIYYIVIYSIVLLTAITQLFLKHVEIEGTISGLEFATMIFLFVCGLNSFKPQFKLLLANGVSRKTMFKSVVMTVGCVVVILALIDSLSSMLFSSITNYNSMFYQVYHARYVTVSAISFQVFAEGFLWRIFTYAMITFIGFFITVMYYRMDKALKLIVSIGIPVFLFIILPFIDAMFFGGLISDGLSNLMDKVFSFMYGYGHYPYMAYLSYTAVSAIFGALSYLLMRRATVKD